MLWTLNKIVSIVLTSGKYGCIIRIYGDICRISQIYQEGRIFMRIKKIIAAAAAVSCFASTSPFVFAEDAVDYPAGVSLLYTDHSGYCFNVSKGSEMTFLLSAKDGDKFTFVRDWEHSFEHTSQAVLNIKGITIDLNGCDVDVHGVAFNVTEGKNAVLTDSADTKGKLSGWFNILQVAEGASLTINDAYVESTSESSRTISTKGDLSVKNSTITGKYGVIGIDAVGNNDKCVITLEGDDTLIKGTERGSDAIFIEGNSKLVVNGGNITADTYAISGNGTNNVSEYRGGSEIEINGGTIEGANYGLYLPQYGTVRISNGTIAAEQTAVEIASGDLYISGGDLSSTVNECATSPLPSGAYTAGSAVAVVCRTKNGANGIHGGGYYGEMNVDITGGTFSGVYPFAKYITAGSDEGSSLKSLNISGGTFTCEDGIDINSQKVSGQSVYVQNGCDGGFINGGRFNTDVSEYTAADRVCMKSSDRMFDVFKTQIAETDNIEVPEDKKSDVSSELNEQFGVGTSDNNYKLHKITVNNANGNIIRIQYDFQKDGKVYPWYKEFTGTQITNSDVVIGVVLYNIPEGADVGEPTVYIR